MPMRVHMHPPGCSSHASTLRGEWLAAFTRTTGVCGTRSRPVRGGRILKTWPRLESWTGKIGCGCGIVTGLVAATATLQERKRPGARWDLGKMIFLRVILSFFHRCDIGGHQQVHGRRRKHRLQTISGSARIADDIPSSVYACTVHTYMASGSPVRDIL